MAKVCHSLKAETARYPISHASASNHLRSVLIKPLHSSHTPKLILCLWIMLSSIGLGQGVPTVVRDILPGTQGFNPANHVAMNGSLYFAANGPNVYEGQFWKSNGTAAGTVRVKAIAPRYSTFFAFNNVLIFCADDQIHGHELWRSDGTMAGTVLVKDIIPGGVDSIPGRTGWVQVNGMVFFSASTSDAGEELWRTDGTAAGTRLVKDVWPGGESSSPRCLTNVNGTLFFVVSNNGGTALWKSDGTNAGTQLVKSFPNGNFADNPSFQPLLSLDGLAYFLMDDYWTGLQIWKSDGTPEGTMGAVSVFQKFRADPAQLVALNGKVFFTARDYEHGRQLWTLDETDDGAHRVTEFLAPANSVGPQNLTACNNELYFTGIVAPSGPVTQFVPALWKTDGTSAGTVLLTDLGPGASLLHPYFTALAGKIYFCVNDGIHGEELWQSDGTKMGTRMVQDLNLGSAGSSPWGLTAVNGQLFFSATGKLYDQELWKLGTPNPFTKVAINTLSSDQLVAAGNTVNLAVSASGYPAPNCQWLKNGKAMTDAIFPAYTVPAAGFADAASYNVRLTNPMGVVTSAAVKLGVVNTAPTKVATSNLGTMVLAVQAAGTGLTYQWHKNNSADVIDGGRYKGAKTSKLSITKFTYADESDSYTCTVTMGALHRDTGVFLPQVRRVPELAPAATAPVSFYVSGTVNQPVTGLITVVNEVPNHPTSYKIEGLPAGMTYNSATGALSGRPYVSGDYVLTITASNQAGTGTPVNVVMHVQALDQHTVGRFNGLADFTSLAISLQVSDNGTFTGNILLAGVKTPFSGRLETSGGQNPMVSGLRLAVREPTDSETNFMILSFSLSKATGALSGTLNYVGYQVFNLSGWQSPWTTVGMSPLLATAYAGSYTAAITLPPEYSFGYSRGSGYLVLLVDPAGVATFSGRTGNGGVVTWSTMVGSGGQVSFSSAGLGYRQLIQGWLKITPVVAPGQNRLDSDTWVDWFQTSSYGRLPAFDHQSLSVQGGLWNAPAPGTVVLGVSEVADGDNNAKLAFSLADIANSALGVAGGGSISQQLRLTSTNTAVMPAGATANPSAATLVLNVSNGTFSGGFSLKDSNPLNSKQIITRSSSFYGALVPRLNRGQGFFLLNQLPQTRGQTPDNTPTMSGLVILRPD
ncbi:MAG: Flagellar hook-length control protein FliK [Verrucomicrobiaceae bacterium]|nr:Flagellar hook-length control protein FliK [Verrucomicrobiaceae bacterium]